MKIIYVIVLSFLAAIVCLSCTDNKLTDNVTYYPKRIVTPVNTEVSTSAISEQLVFITPSGKKYHYSISCAGKNAVTSSLEEVDLLQKEPCKRCVK